MCDFQELLQDSGVEHLAANRHPLPHVIEQLAVDGHSDLAAGLLQHGMRSREKLVVAGELLQAKVVDLDHAELFEVGVRVPPAASLIEPDPVGQDLAKRPLCLLKVEATQRGLEQPLGADLRIRPVEAERPLLGDAKLLASEPIRGCVLKRAEEARTDEAHEEEVVEMAGLERGVLTVVGEAEELPRVEIQARLGAVHPAQRARHEHRGRRAATLRGE